MEKYILTSTIYHGEKEYIFYGIALIKEYNNQIEILDEQPTLSDDMNKIESIIEIFNECKLDPSHLHEIAEDILNMIN